MKLLLQLLAILLNSLPKTRYKPIPLCDVYGRYGLNAPNLVGHASSPSVTTDSTPSSITTTSAVFDTNSITNTGGQNATVRGICYVSGAGGTPTTADTVVSTSGSYSTGNYSSTMSGLTAGTTYSVRAFATNSGGTGYGSTVEVTTLTGIPTITTGNDGSVTSTTATISTNNISSTNGGTISSYGVVWNTSTNPTIANNVAQTGTSFTTGNYNTNLTGLPSGTLIYFRAYATTAQGTGYGSTDSFTATNPPNLDQTAYRFYEDGAETTSTAIDAQNTNITRDVSSGDSNLQLRVRLQETIGGAGLSTDDYQLQYELNDSGTYQDIFSTSPVTIDSSTSINIGQAFDGSGQSLTGDGRVATSASFYLTKVGSPTGTGVMKLYAHSGTYGTSSVPTGSPLATSETKDLSTISSSGEWVNLKFTSPYATVNGTRYFLAWESTYDASNYISVGAQFSNVHSGNRAALFGGTWNADSIDVAFYLYSDLAIIGYNSSSLTEGNATTERLAYGGQTVFAEDYNDNTTNTTLWDAIGLVSETGGQLEMDSNIGTTDYAKYESDATYDLTNSYIQQELIDAGNQSLATWQVKPVEIHNAAVTNAIVWGVEDGKLFLQQFVAPSSYTTLKHTTTYSSTDHRFFRLAFYGGNIYAQTAPSANGPWTTDHSFAEPFSITAMHIETSAGTYSGEASATTSIVDNFYHMEGNFVAGKISEDGLVDNVQITANNYTELLYSLTIDSDAVDDGDTLDFRVLRNGAVLDTYTVTPRITIEEGSGTDTVIPNDSSWTFVADSTTITQNHVLSPNDSAFIFIADNGTINQNHVLSPNDSQFTFIADTTTVEETHILSPNDSAFVFVADSTTITQNHILSPNDSSFTFIADAAQFSQDHVIQPADSHWTLVADGTTISQDHLVAPNDAQFTFIADSATITQNHVLTAQDAQFTFIADSGTINQNHDLTAQDSSWDFVADATTVEVGAITIESANSFWTFEADATTISQVHDITPADSQFTFVADGATITQDHQLSPNDSFFAFVADAPQISQDHIIQSADSYWNFIADGTTIIENYTFSPNDSQLTFIADSTTLTQNHILSPNDSQFTFTADATTISQDHNLTAQDSSWTFIADGAQFSQDHVIQSADSHWAFVADATTLTQNHIIETQDSAWNFIANATTIDLSVLLQTQHTSWDFVADSTSISQNHVIAGDDSQFTFIADSPQLSQDHVIQSADSYWTFVADSTTIEQTQLIVPQDTNWVFTADSSTITQNHILTPNDAFWGFVADASQLSQDHVVQGADSYWTLNADSTAISQNHVVTAQAATLEFIADSITIDYNNILSGADSFWSFIADSNAVTQNHVITPDDSYFEFVADATTVSSQEVQINGTKAYFGGAPRKYYIDSNGTVYWVINQSAGIVEKV